MVLWSANDCIIQNIEFFAGVAGTNSKQCLQVTGQRNHFINCHIAGIGHTANDTAGASSLYINGGRENVFERCVIGLDTIPRGGAANYEILLDNGAARNVFKDCIILSNISSSTNHPQVYTGSAAAMGADTFNMFDNCAFINVSLNYTHAQTYVMAAAAAPTEGIIVVRNCTAHGATNWSASGNKVDIAVLAADAAYTAGIGYEA
jgi:hypothetical protein